MARYWVTGGTGNYNSTTNWSNTSGGASGFSVPTSSDDVIFDANSGAGTANINVSSAAKTLTCTNFTGTLNFQNTLTVSGSITLGASMSFSNTSGTPLLSITVASATLTSNGVTFPYTLQLAGSGLTPSYTFGDNWTVGNLTLNSGSSNMTILGSKTIYIDGNLTESMAGNKTATGTTFTLQGTGTWSNSSVGFLECNITFNTAGTITISGTIRWRNGTITYTAGTVTTTGSSLFCTAIASGTTTFNTSGMTWNNITIGGNTGMTWNASSTFYMSGNMTFGGGGGVLQGMWEVQGNLTHTGGTSYTNVAGATVTMTGTGNLSTTSGGSFTCNITINTAGTITVISSSTFRFNTGTLTYTAGTVITTGNTMSISLNCTLATNGITWNNITTATGLTTLTLTNKLTVSGELWFQGDTTISGDVFETYGLMIGQITTSNSIDLLLVASKEYIVTGYLRHYGARQGAPGTIKSASAGTKTLLTVRQGSTQNIGYVDVTDVNSLNGITLRSYSGSFSNTDNWIRLNQEYTIGNGS